MLFKCFQCREIPGRIKTTIWGFFIFHKGSFVPKDWNSGKSFSLESGLSSSCLWDMLHLKRWILQWNDSKPKLQVKALWPGTVVYVWGALRAIEFCWAGNSLLHSKFVSIQSTWTWPDASFFSLPTLLCLFPSLYSFVNTDQGCALQVDPLIFPWRRMRSKHNNQGGTNKMGSAVWSSCQASSLRCRFPWQWRRWDQSFY